jgi:hypothetical protein
METKMDYKKIHDSIISRAKSRTVEENVYYENHHIIPKCEGGLLEGETVPLTSKEHKIIHLLRYKMNGNIYNYYAYCLMKGWRNRKKRAKLGARLSHIKYKERDPKGYLDRQKKAGLAGGKAAFDKNAGFHAMSEEERFYRTKGTDTLVREKIGMFSDEYRKLHAKNLQKMVLTPDGLFDSMGDAATHYGVSAGTMTYRVNSNSDRFAEWKIVKGNTDVTNG